MLQRLTHRRNLFRPQTRLAGLAAGIVNVENPKRMPFTARALRATAGVVSDTFQQRAAQDIAGRGKRGSEFVAFADGLLTCHLHR